MHQHSKLVDCVRVSVCVSVFVYLYDMFHPKAGWKLSACCFETFLFFLIFYRVTTNEFGEGFCVRVIEKFSFFLFLGRLHVDRKLSAKVIFTFNALFFFKFTQAGAKYLTVPEAYGLG